jgi:hypothetical protein
MSVPDLSVFLPPTVVDALSGFIETLDEGSRVTLSRALDAVIDDVAVEWRERIGDLDGEAEFDHALLRGRADVASTLRLHYLKDFGGGLTWSIDEPDYFPRPSDEQRSRPRDLVSASIGVLRKNSPVIGVFRDDSDGDGCPSPSAMTGAAASPAFRPRGTRCWPG